MNRLMAALLGIGAVGLLLLVILVSAAFATFLLVENFTALLQLMPAQPDGSFRTLASLFGVFFSALTATGLAILTFVLNARRAERAQRKQHTINILFQSRMSEYFQDTNRRRKEIFPTDQDIFLEDWKEKRALGGKFAEGADALQQMLNYYEFIAVGINQKDLDEELLRQSLRGIMCNLVDDARFMIAELRAGDEKTLTHLAELYERWRDKGEKRNYVDKISERPLPSPRELRFTLQARARSAQSRSGTSDQ